MSTRKAETKDWFYLLFLLVTFIPRMIWGGYVAQCLWIWFLVPLGLPAINIAWAMGLMAALSFSTGTGAIQLTLMNVPKKEEEDRFSTQLVGWLAPALLLLQGWILTHWL